VVSEVTLQCVPCYTLHEKTYCSTAEEVRRNHAELLRTYRHVRYMWVPYTETVVVVVSDVAEPGAKAKPALPEEQRVKPLRDLLQQLEPGCGDLSGQNFAQLRERLLVLDPLDARHVARVNAAEAEFWKNSTGERIDDSTAILGFECGGSQWVLENCIPCGTIDNPSLSDIDYLIEIKKVIEENNIAAASPIEQRWTSRSTSPMSPAFSKNERDIFSWVGVIMYIDEARAAETKAKFRDYAEHHADLTFKHGGAFHWAKIDLDFHSGPERLADLRANLSRRFDLGTFRSLRKSLDPNNVLGNRLTDEALSK
jgi:L-galactono-1,4-lactone dehydrogenase